jgi:hypothetical protein
VPAALHAEPGRRAVSVDLARVNGLVIAFGSSRRDAATAPSPRTSMQSGTEALLLADNGLQRRGSALQQLSASTATQPVMQAARCARHAERKIRSRKQEPAT